VVARGDAAPGGVPERGGQDFRTRNDGSPLERGKRPPSVLETIDLFGVVRCAFASNFPVDGIMSSYDAIWNAFKEITAGFSESERDMLFHDNAARLYRI
jgi:hypothetical protein